MNDYQRVGIWQKHEDNDGILGKGAREKVVLVSPKNSQAPIKPDHWYIFKHSMHRYPWEFWAEIIAYRLGTLMGLSVAPAYPAVGAWDTCGALIEWFFGVNGSKDHYYYDGLGAMQSEIQDYDAKEGRQHNFETIRSICLKVASASDFVDSSPDYWIDYWVSALLFDALIGNTDRHQNNWGIIQKKMTWDKAGSVFFSPLFDHGTSMGSEILEANFPKFNTEADLTRYANKGTHHMKWSMADIVNKKGCPHFEMIEHLLNLFPQKKSLMGKLLAFSWDEFENMVHTLTVIDVPVPLSKARAEFVIKLTAYRRRRLLNIIGSK